jgi:excisionase family DNA binding protein
MEQLLMKISEVAQALGISKSTTYAMAAKGEIPVVQIRGGLRVPSEALRAWLNKTFSEQQNGKDRGCN